MKWERIVSGRYVSGDYKIVRQPTTFGMRRATNDMWFVYINGAVLARRATLAEAKGYAEHHRKAWSR